MDTPPSLKKQKSVNYEEQVVEYFTILQDKIENFNKQIEGVLTQHEEDFMNAFKAHMYEIQKQLQHFKDFKTLEQERKRRDKELTDMANALEWYKQEAHRLDEALMGCRQELLRWKAKSQAAEEDNKFMQEQLKTSKKEINFWRQRNEKPTMTPQTQATSPTFLRTVESPLKSDKTPDIVNHYQKALSQERRKLRQLNALTSQTLERRSDLEDVFLSCVTEVRKQVIRRSPNVRTDAFTATDKRRILELLISNDKVLTLVYEQLFPHRKPDFSFSAASPELEQTASTQDKPIKGRPKSMAEVQLRKFFI
mmetsp:Transcript_20795/g.38638  ORF Transcript_20795/g.38638 Transcript_20795/m.38638 type:complete len:309 (+) Transcript_20795:384-1310(+)